MWGAEPETATGVGPGRQSGFTSGGTPPGTWMAERSPRDPAVGSRRVGASPAARSGHLRPGRQPATLPKDNYSATTCLLNAALSLTFAPCSWRGPPACCARQAFLWREEGVLLSPPPDTSSLPRPQASPNS